MKRLILLITIGFLTTPVFSQIKFGVKGGINVSNARYSQSMDYRVAPLFGCLAEFQINENVNFQSELVYSKEGAEDEYDESFYGWSGKVKETLKVTYLNVPLLLRYKLGKGFKLLGGTQIGFLLEADQVLEFVNSSHDPEVKNLTDEMNSCNVSLCIGTSWEAKCGLGIDARYNGGLSNVSNQDTELILNGFQFSLFQKF